MNRAWRSWFSWLGIIILGAIAASPIWTQFDRIRVPEKNDDWDNQLLLAESQREALFHYGEFPLWNSYPEGGTPLLANPESSIAYPLTWFTLPFSSQTALKIQILVHFALGLVGMYWFARGMMLGPASSAYAAVTFMAASVFFERMRTGHLMWMGMAYVPWALRTGLEWNRRNRALTVLALACQWLMGAHYLVIYTFVALLTMRYYELTRTSRRAAWSVPILGATLVILSVVPPTFRPILTFLPLIPLFRWALRPLLRETYRLAIILILFCSVSSVKLLPTLELWSLSPRFSETGLIVPPDDGLIQSFAKWAGLLERDNVEVHEDQPTLYHPVPVVLALVGAFVIWGESRGLLLLFLVGWCWSLGPRCIFGLSRLAESLPLLSALRYCTRASVLTLFCLAALAGRGAQAIADRATNLPVGWIRASSAVLLPVSLSLSAGWMAVQSRDIVRGTFNAVEPSSPKAYSKFKRTQCRGSMYSAFLENAGCIDGFTAVPLANARHVAAAGTPEYKGESYLSDGKGTADIVERTPTGLEVEVRDTHISGYLVVNQSYYPGWGLKDGAQAIQWRGLLAVPIEVGRKNYAFVFQSKVARWGALISIMTVTLMAFRVIRQARNSIGERISRGNFIF